MCVFMTYVNFYAVLKYSFISILMWPIGETLFGLRKSSKHLLGLFATVFGIKMMIIIC
jgi:hypothetical protein